MFSSSVQLAPSSVLLALLGLTTLFQPGGDTCTRTEQQLNSNGTNQAISALDDAVRQHHQYQAAIPHAQQLLHSPEVAGDRALTLKVSSILGSAQLGSVHYRDALQTLLPARSLAIQQHNSPELLRIDNNISWIYLEMNNLDAAARFADEALSACSALGKYSPAVSTLRGFVFAKSGDMPHAEGLFLNAVSHAIDSGDLNSAAAAWHFLGASYLESHQLAKAEFAETEAFRLRATHHLPDLDQSLRDLARVLAQKGDLKLASVLMDEALASMGNPKSTAPIWFFFRARGELRMMSGDLESSYRDLQAALELARRLDVVPTDDDRVTFESGLAELYSLYIDVGNRLYFRNHDEKLKAEIFNAAEGNRAASLCALVPQPHGWRSKLPPSYSRVLAELQIAERNTLADQSAAADARVRALRSNLSEIEATAGAEGEMGSSSALERARDTLDGDSALLAFHLGPQSSWIWAVTKDKLDVFPLPSKMELAASGEIFTSELRGDKFSEDLASALGNRLFSELPDYIQSKHRWILALDQDLFELPIGALRWKGHYLAELHTLLLTPSISLMDPASVRAPIHGPMIGVGDAVYNFADPRWTGSRGWLKSPELPSYCRLARLTGSGVEVQKAVKTWGSGTVLTGTQANKANLQKSLNESPAILHLATHIIRSPGKERAGLIVLGLNSQNQPDLLGMREILLHPSNISLVVMSGCASGDAVALPAAGLMGLTRAWLGAGVGEILATRWPSLDDSGPFFQSFYGNLRNNPVGGAPEALHKTQVEMIQSHSFRSNPEYWASYFLIGKS